LSDAAAIGPVEQPTLFYQPQVTADGGRFVGLEALLRARRPDGAITGPQEMLAAIATPDEADALDWRILRQACGDARRWPDLSVAINVGARQFQQPDFSARMIALIAEVGVAPTQIELELLEGTIIEDFDRASATMEALRAHGVRIALDDFGTGYSSLSYLQRLPLDKLKLDKSMVEGVGNLKAAAIVQAVTALSRALGLKVVAEGVETQEQQRFLRISGCHYLQGYLFSPAISADAVDELLRQRWPRAAPG
jgi:EAL domain-containing protein (putative c-di-GMP-specific phosphodiesterase class I)